MKKALLIGINYSSLGEGRLHGCINDTVAIKNMLVDAYGYSVNDIKILRDDVDPVSESSFLPSRSNILSSLNTLMNESSSLDEIWIHYSGHGSYISDTNDDEYDGHDEIIIPCDYQTNGIIVDDQLRSILNNAKCKVMITMDCCNSGTNWDIVYSFPIIRGRIYRRIENRIAMTNKNIYMLSGARDDQLAGDYFNFESKIPMGVFTMVLLDCLRNRSHKVSLLQLYLDINAMFDKYSFTQDCLLSSSNHLPFVNIERAPPGLKTRSLGLNTRSSTQSSSNVGNSSSLNGRMRSLLTV